MKPHEAPSSNPSEAKKKKTKIKSTTENNLFGSITSRNVMYEYMFAKLYRV
jgi:hypothetical protein